jgi:hypothetical protein
MEGNPHPAILERVEMSKKNMVKSWVVHVHFTNGRSCLNYE